MIRKRLVRFLAVCSLTGVQLALAQPPDQDFEGATAGAASPIGPTGSYTLDGVTYSASYNNNDQLFVHDTDIGVFLSPQFLSLAANLGQATSTRIADAGGAEFKFEGMDLSFGNCGAGGFCSGIYQLIPEKDGAPIPGAVQLVNWDGDGPAISFDSSSLTGWNNIDAIRIERATAGTQLYVAIDNLDFSPAEISVGGLVTGLVPSESVVLQNNGGDDLTVSSDGSFTFATPLAPGATYSVTVLTQPGPITETCTVTNGSGTITNTDITNVAVACAINTYSVGGTVSGLAAGESIELLNLGADTQTLTSDGSFVFTAQADGSTYQVTVGTQPTSQTCSVANGTGSLAGADIGSVAVTCVDDPVTPPTRPVPVPLAPLWLVGLMALAIAGIGSVRIRRKPTNTRDT